MDVLNYILIFGNTIPKTCYKDMDKMQKLIILFRVLFNKCLFYCKILFFKEYVRLYILQGSAILRDYSFVISPAKSEFIR